MSGSSHFTRRAGWLALLAVFVLMGALTTISPTQAQTVPTATPTDPMWLAYSAARDAVEEKFNVDLTIVRNWEFAETEFTDGIDSCTTLDEGETAQQLYYGWRFVYTALDGRQFEGRSSFNAQIVTACDTVTAASAAPAPAGTNPDLPPPVAGSAAVGGFELGGQVLQFNSNTVGLMNRAGMRWAKQQFRYGLGQDPSAAAGAINAAHASGLKIVLSVVGDKTQMGDYASYINSYASFVGGVAGLGADAIEVWNESNIDREWPAASINGATYTQLLAAAFNAIKSRNPATIVISGAPAPTGFFGSAGCGSGGCNDDVYMQQMAAAGAANYMDCVGLHYNEGIIPPTQNSADPRGGYPSYYFSSMLQRGYGPFGGKPVCFTELGYLSGQGYAQAIPANFGWAANTTVAQQASWLAGAATASAQSGKVRLMIVWNVDFPFFTADDPVGGYGIFR
ncbi:MAG: hypothetical protein ABI835_15460, partial [Chloroflexota bacterium]